MGTAISLDVGGIEICWSKNSMGIDHGSLFQERDRKRIPEPSLDPEDDYEASPEFEMGFQRTLGSTIARLELLGYTIETVRNHYLRAVEECSQERDGMREHAPDLAGPTEFMTFEDLLAFVSENPVDELDDQFISSLDAPKSQIVGRFNDEARLSRLPYYESYETGYSERNHFGVLIGFLPPYSFLRLLATVPQNRDLYLNWQYGPLVEAGWAQVSDFVAEARRTEKFLIATEGTSDIFVLKRALQLLRPEITDFFRFIDATERHPFSGAGRLVNFAEGLAKIDIHNKVLFLLDNDAEGQHAHQKIMEMHLPSNMRTTTLPDHPSFERINTHGPAGETVTNINGRAVALECYLDFDQPSLPEPQVRWTSYKDKLDTYQGELIGKDHYLKAFKNAEKLEYDFSKLAFLLDHIVQECCAIASP